MKRAEVIGRARRHLTPALVFHTDAVASSGRGAVVEAAGGGSYLDFTSGLATVSTGHCHPEVVKAIREQAGRLIHAGGIFYHEPLARLAERLAGIAPKGIDSFFFSNSGAEAVEGAVKLARLVTGRQGVIAFTGGFHGRTLGAISLTSSSARYRRGYHPLVPSVYHAPYPYCFRCPMGQKRGDCSLECFDYLATRTLRHHIYPDEVACAVIEPVLGEGGYSPAPREFILKLRELCSRHGILLVADEVQTGFGRTGRWFAAEHYGITPDVVAMGKGIASGMPLSAVGASRALMAKWPPGAHGTTFGGNPVSCAAALATIDVIEKEGLLKNAERAGRRAVERLERLKRKRPALIGDVRGVGLMIGVEFIGRDCAPDARALAKVIKRCLKKGLVIVECGIDRNVARLMPPLNVTDAEMDRALTVFEEAVG